MQSSNLNIYQRLRDFEVPAPVLDEIFSNKKDLNTLVKSWDELKEQGLKDDQIAKAVAEIILKELGDDFLQSLENSSIWSPIIPRSMSPSRIRCMMLRVFPMTNSTSIPGYICRNRPTTKGNTYSPGVELAPNMRRPECSSSIS